MVDITPPDQRMTDAERATATRLREWSDRSRAKANRIVMACAALSVIWLIWASSGAPEQALLLRRAAVLFIAFHGVTYVLWLRMLRRWVARGLPEAQRALTAYTDPYRLTNLDLAMFWVAFYLLAPLFA